MPHFVIECSKGAVEGYSIQSIIQEVHTVADDSGLFKVQDIKVRLKSYEIYTVGTDDSDFIHVFASIMEGRTTAQKAQLSKSVVQRLMELFPNVPNIAMNVWEFEKATYVKRTMLE